MVINEDTAGREIDRFGLFPGIGEHNPEPFRYLSNLRNLFPRSISILFQHLLLVLSDDRLPRRFVTIFFIQYPSPIS
jgi:hypothetical protein